VICPYCRITLVPDLVEEHMRRYHPHHAVFMTARKWVVLTMAIVFVIVITLGGVYW
jgi:hypothetical protein